MAVADGIALAHKLASEAKISAVFSGDGGSSEGDFHEALNVAAVWELPVLFVIENNGYGLSTPSNEQFRFKHFTDKGPAYGMKAVQIDGNNVLEMFHAVNTLAAEMRTNPHPVLLECITFRMRGHEEASGTKYVPQELFDIWEKKDPVNNYEVWLMAEGILTDAHKEQVRAQIKEQIEEADGRRGNADHKQRQHPAVIRNPARYQQPKAECGKCGAQPAIRPARGRWRLHGARATPVISTFQAGFTSAA
jgi:2-oxoisovalerate dehydrogenase E1 component